MKAIQLILISLSTVAFLTVVGCNGQAGGRTGGETDTTMMEQQDTMPGDTMPGDTMPSDTTPEDTADTAMQGGEQQMGTTGLDGRRSRVKKKLLR